MSNFKAKILDVATKEINQKSDISLSYKTIKDGRNITGYQFFVEEKSKSKKGLFLMGNAKLLKRSSCQRNRLISLQVKLLKTVTLEANMRDRVKTCPFH